MAGALVRLRGSWKPWQFTWATRWRCSADPMTGERPWQLRYIDALLLLFWPGRQSRILQQESVRSFTAQATALLLQGGLLSCRTYSETLASGCQMCC